MADFEATNQLWRREPLPRNDLPTALRENLLRADPALLTAAFEAARREYGTMHRYFANALHLGTDRLSGLQSLLLE